MQKKHLTSVCVRQREESEREKVEGWKESERESEVPSKGSV